MIIDYQNYSLESEQSVIGGLLIDNYKLHDVCEIITANDFFLASHKNIFRAIEVLAESNIPVDPTTVISKLSDHDCLESSGGLGYLAELAHNTPSASNVVAYAARVLEKRKERDVLYMASQMVSAIKDENGSSDERINNAMSVITNYDSCEKKTNSYADFNREFILKLQERSQKGGGLTGESSGFNDIDLRLNGLQKSDLIIVAGRPGSGKTTYAVNIACHVAKEKPVIIFSLEMSGVQIVEKVYSSTGIRLKGIKTGQLNDDEWQHILVSGKKAKELKLDIDDRGGLKPQQIRAKCLSLKRKYGEIGLVVVDYLQLMTTNNSESRVNEITKISGALKALAKELDSPVIALSQLNRSVESRSNKRPVMSDLRDSGAIEQDADIIQFIYRDDYYAEQECRESKNPGIAEINTAKFRGGEVGVNYLKTELQYSRFVDLPTNFQPVEDKEERFKYE